MPKPNAMRAKRTPTASIRKPTVNGQTPNRLPNAPTGNSIAPVTAPPTTNRVPRL